MQVLNLVRLVWGGSLREALHAAYMGEYLDLRYRKCLAICSFVLVNTFSPVEGGIFVWFSFEKNTAQKIPRTQNSNIFKLPKST